MSVLTNSPAWQKLQTLQSKLVDFSIGAAFAEDEGRAQKFSAEACGIFLDYSKNLVNSDVISALTALAEQQGLSTAITSLRQGGKVNHTESRAALHWLLRTPSNKNEPGLNNEQSLIRQSRERIKIVSTAINQSEYRSASNEAFTDIVHLGIGGSDLGPAMAYQALKPYQKTHIRCHFVANICASDISETLQTINPSTTLFIIASKSFSTLETLQNAKTAKTWLLNQLNHIDDDAIIAKHFFAITSQPEKANHWGIPNSNIFPIWDWVGGRYSVWSAIHLSLAIGLGNTVMDEFLAGAHAMDEHFFTAPIKENLPALLGLIGIWYTNFWGRQAHTIIPYEHRLRRFTAYLQQLEMESTGKSVDIHGQSVDYATCPDIWGEAGSNSQHSFFQQFHLGSDFTPVDFIAVLDNPAGLDEHQDWLIASCLAQSRALMLGKHDNENPHKNAKGNRPSSILLLHTLTPQTLGSLMALYEHKVYVQSTIWQLNAFDQWGVELGKLISNNVKDAIDGKALELDASTLQLIHRYQDSKK